MESATTEFCNLPTKKLTAGANTVLFSELFSACHMAANPPKPAAETAQSALIKIVWQVVTNTEATVPFGFCVSNLRALRK
ncbi:MAG: hypothetical protein K0R38_6460 [Polyangiaceae bacterium]|nr:hypothetical protein [Polyangiaceae bacterium]